MTMTTQPIKNDQAVAQMVSNQATLPQNSHLAPQSQQSHKSPPGTDKVVQGNKAADGDNSAKNANSFNAAAAKDILSGATTASAKDATTRLNGLQSGKETGELQVLAVRTSKAVEKQMETVQSTMNEIVNSYPPFLRGSEKRQQYLMSISSIRQQIEAMTIPPTGKLDSPSLDATSSKEAKKMWANLFQDVNVPALAANGPGEASDAQIKAASAAVGISKTDLANRRDALEQQAAPVGISPIMAQYMSQTAGHVLAQTGLSLTTNLTGVLKGL